VEIPANLASARIVRRHSPYISYSDVHVPKTAISDRAAVTFVGRAQNAARAVAGYIMRCARVAVRKAFDMMSSGCISRARRRSALADKHYGHEIADSWMRSSQFRLLSCHSGRSIAIRLSTFRRDIAAVKALSRSNF